jgi:S1-C subfamily serine protease
MAGIRGGSPETAVRSGSNVIYLGGDIIVGIGDQQVTSLGDFYAALERTRPGQVVTVRLVRGRRELTVEVKLATRTGESP